MVSKCVHHIYVHDPPLHLLRAISQYQWLASLFFFSLSQFTSMAGNLDPDTRPAIFPTLRSTTLYYAVRHCTQPRD